ncbi:hypothetical protein Sdiek1_2364 [Sulfurospirillum diekertiae]|uniref:Uncharacterized protein n=1 Tax=Sulfurospirillum diekertiae TaxID=1854492 RepID=A0A1Y0HQ79_9BACT|nr:hypothetical protein [Sulfurospirillum diekertiae]ARU49514.1 hypothetical protein Sdiek1_2364 [Sulfurospirillum diekertiae]
MKLMREYLEKNFLLLFFSFVLVAFYNYIVFKNIYSLAYVPDETWFYRTAIQSYINDTFRNNLFHVNDFGYGGLWWSVYTIFIHMFHSMIDYTFLLSQDALLNRTEFLSFIREDLTQLYPLIAMRFINLFLLNIVFIIIIYKSIQQNILFISGLVVLLLTPMLYWSGKMASPELTAITIEFIGIYYFFQKRYYLAIFLLIFSLGIKPTVLPVIVVVGLFLLYQLYKTNSLNLSYLMKLFMCAICGFIVSNPIVLLHPKTYVKTLLSFKNLFSLKEYGVFDNIEDQIQHIIFKENFYMWEGTMYGSLEYWSFPIIILCCLFFILFCIFTKKRKPTFCYVGICILCVIYAQATIS